MANEKVVLNIDVNDGASKPLEQVEQKLDGVDKSGQGAAESVKKVDAGLDDLGTSAKKTGDDLKDAGANLDDMQDKLDGVSSAAEQLGGSSGALGSISEGLALLKSPALAAAGAITAVTSAVTANSLEYSRLKDVIVGFTGSQQRANEIIEQARVLANNLGTDVSETAKTWLAFDDTMRAIGLSADQSYSFFEKLSYAIIQTGGSVDDVKETVEEFREGLTDGTLNRRKSRTSF